MQMSRLPIYIDAQLPDIVLLPGKVQISGTVYDASGSVSDSAVTIGFRNSSITTQTSHDGSFTARLEAPLDFTFIGPRELTITVAPDEPQARD